MGAPPGKRRTEKRHGLAVIAFFLAILAVAGNACGDEFHLKDGSKIVGTIVGFEDGAFKVQTAYGFALVRKDSIAEIVTAEKNAPLESKPTPSPQEPVRPAPQGPVRPALSEPVRPAPAVKPASLAAPDSKPTPSPQEPVRPAPQGPVRPALSGPVRPALQPMPRPIPQYVTAPSKPRSAASSTNATPPAVAPASSSLLLPDLSGLLRPSEALDPRAQPMQEVVRGNLYVNQTYGFQIYRPPAWQVIKNAQNELPNAVGALGTDDQTSLLVIGRDPLKDSLETQEANRERTLQDVYENYRPAGKKQISIAGLPAIELRFYGSLGGRNWSVMMATLARGKEVFTILGMTSADSDLIQIQENVIARTIASLQFLSSQ